MESGRRAVLAFVIAVTSLAACGGLPGRGGSSRDYSISVNRQDYSRGNTGEATIRNSTDETLEYNLCQRRLERRANNNWVVAFEWPTAGGACTTEARSLSKGATVNTFFEIPTGVPVGTYRVVFTGLLGESGTQLGSDRSSTPTFEVR